MPEEYKMTKTETAALGKFATKKESLRELLIVISDQYAITLDSERKWWKQVEKRLGLDPNAIHIANHNTGLVKRKE